MISSSANLYMLRALKRCSINSFVFRDNRLIKQIMKPDVLKKNKIDNQNHNTRKTMLLIEFIGERQSHQVFSQTTVRNQRIE